MTRFRLLFTVGSLLVCFAAPAPGDDWPVWRGPNRNNIAAENQTPPTNWDEQSNIIWKTEVPGRGHSSPIIVGDRIFLATAEEDSQTQSVICFDRKTGSRLWQTTVNEGGLESRIHPNNTHASQTIVTQGDKLFVVFNNHGGVQLAALDADGKLLWEKTTGPFVPKYPFGFGSSPCLYKNLVIVMSDYPKEGYLAAYDQSNGSEVWRTRRGRTSSYGTPIVAEVAGRDQLIVSGSDIAGYDPATGEELWTVPGPWQTTCGTLVWDGDVVFAGGGFPAQATLAVSVPQKKILWQKPVKVYEQSLIVHDGYVYAHADIGVAYCWRASDGQEMWKARVTSKGVSASPVLVGDLIYLTSEKGEMVVIRANPEAFEKVSENQLGGAAFATPTIVDSRIYARVGSSKDASPQYLYCIGKP